ncbi:MAG: CDP-alcohol phosphatidyltransferase family protein, partial [Myxococcales bacterium]|nr:CDP-alcohol phosphatidyltransferase family protein [Myxococcales bacterium]
GSVAAAEGADGRRIVACAAPYGTRAALELLDSDRALPDHAVRVPLDDQFLVAAATPAERRASARLHLRSLIKPTSGAFERFYMRPISLRITRLLMRTRVTPNAVSWATLALAFISAGLVASPSRGAVVAGGLLHMFMRVVDCVDGELARLRYQGSTFGAWLDTVGDGIGIAAFIAGVTVQVAVVQGHPELLWVGLLGVAAWLFVQAVQVAAALTTGAAGTFQVIEWGHRKPTGDRSLVERVTGSLELLLRIDALSTYYGLAVILGAYRTLLVAHTTLTVLAAGYFGRQLLRLRAARA